MVINLSLLLKRGAISFARTTLSFVEELSRSFFEFSKSCLIAVVRVLYKRGFQSFLTLSMISSSSGNYPKSPDAFHSLFI